LSQIIIDSGEGFVLHHSIFIAIGCRIVNIQHLTLQFANIRIMIASRFNKG